MSVQPVKVHRLDLSGHTVTTAQKAIVDQNNEIVDCLRSINKRLSAIEQVIMREGLKEKLSSEELKAMRQNNLKKGREKRYLNQVEKVKNLLKTHPGKRDDLIFIVESIKGVTLKTVCKMQKEGHLG